MADSGFKPLTLADMQSRVAKHMHQPQVKADGRRAYTPPSAFDPRAHEHASNQGTGPARSGAPKHPSVSPAGGFPVHDGMQSMTRDGEHLTGQRHADRNSYPDASSPNVMDPEGNHPKQRPVPSVPGMRSRINDRPSAEPGENHALNKQDDAAMHANGRAVLAEGRAAKRTKVLAHEVGDTDNSGKRVTSVAKLLGGR